MTDALEALQRAQEAYVRTHPHREDEVDEAFAQYSESAGGVEGSTTPSLAPGTPGDAATGQEVGLTADSEQLALPDPGRQAIGKFNAGGPSTQREAAISQWPISGTQRRKVLDYIEKCGHQGATDEEIERYYGGRHQSVSARRNELMNDGWIEDSTVRRRTSSGRDAIVWIVSEAGRAQYASL